MRNFTIIVIALLLVPGICNASQSDKSNHSKNLEKKIDSISLEISQIGKRLKQADAFLLESNLTKKIEEVSKTTFENQTSIKDKILNSIMWLSGIILALLTLLSVVTGVYYFTILRAKYKADTEKFNSYLATQIPKEIARAENELGEKIKLIMTNFYYDHGIRFMNKGNYSTSFDFFMNLYNTPEYPRRLDVCCHLAECCHSLKEDQQADKYLDEALSLAKDENYIKAIKKLKKEYTPIVLPSSKINKHK